MSTWVTQLALILIGLSSGFAVAGGLFALIIGLGVVPRFAGKTHTGEKLLIYEDCIAIGGAVGNILFIYGVPFKLGAFLLPIIGISSGVFIGCWYMALAEMVDTFPIFFRRIKFVRGLGWVVLCLAVGKSLGALIYFINGW